MEANTLCGNKGFVVIHPSGPDWEAPRWFATPDEAIAAVQRRGVCPDGSVHRVHSVEYAEEGTVPINFLPDLLRACRYLLTRCEREGLGGPQVDEARGLLDKVGAL